MVKGIPTIEVESANGTREISIYTRHLMNRKVFLAGEINDESALEIVSQLMFLQEESDEEISVYINSPGGSVNAGLMIMDVLSSMTVPINLYCIGMAASMAAVILASGKKGRRFILPHSEVMVHEPLLSGGAGGSATSIKRKAESILETKAILNGILAEHTGRTIEEIDNATSYDNYMNAKECVEFGICDKIVKEVF